MEDYKLHYVGFVLPLPSHTIGTDITILEVLRWVEGAIIQLEELGALWI